MLANVEHSNLDLLQILISCRFAPTDYFLKDQLKVGISLSYYYNKFQVKVCINEFMTEMLCFVCCQGQLVVAANLNGADYKKLINLRWTSNNYFAHISIKSSNRYTHKTIIIIVHFHLLVSHDNKMASHTWTKKYDGFEVGIFIGVWGQFGHAVTELLHPPYVLHYEFSFIWRQLI